MEALKGASFFWLLRLDNTTGLLMLTFGPYKTERSWRWEPLRKISFNLAPPLPRPDGGVGHLVGPISLSANTEIEIFAIKCVSFWAQLTIDYNGGRNSDILSALIETNSDDINGVMTHEIAETTDDVDYFGTVDSDGIAHVSARATSDGVLRGNVIYVPL